MEKKNEGKNNKEETEDKYGKGKNCHIYSVGHAVGHPFSDGGWGYAKDGNGREIYKKDASTRWKNIIA